jgi:hypothetical protein
LKAGAVKLSQECNTGLIRRLATLDPLMLLCSIKALTGSLKAGFFIPDIYSK